jgi:hypothetical protein
MLNFNCGQRAPVKEIVLTSDHGWMIFTERVFTYFYTYFFIFNHLRSFLTSVAAPNSTVVRTHTLSESLKT